MPRSKLIYHLDETDETIERIEKYCEKTDRKISRVSTSVEELLSQTPSEHGVNSIKFKTEIETNNDDGGRKYTWRTESP